MVRIGMLGSGFVADFYMDGLRDVPGAEVVANYSRSQMRAQEFGTRYGIPRQYTTMEALCADPEVQMVVIGLPNHLHVDAARAATMAQKAMVCTKPLARHASAAAARGAPARVARGAGLGGRGRGGAPSRWRATRPRPPRWLRWPGRRG